MTVRLYVHSAVYFSIQMSVGPSICLYVGPSVGSPYSAFTGWFLHHCSIRLSPPPALSSSHACPWSSYVMLPACDYLAFTTQCFLRVTTVRWHSRTSWTWCRFSPIPRRKISKPISPFKFTTSTTTTKSTRKISNASSKRWRTTRYRLSYEWMWLSVFYRSIWAHTEYTCVHSSLCEYGIFSEQNGMEEVRFVSLLVKLLNLSVCLSVHLSVCLSSHNL